MRKTPDEGYAVMRAQFGLGPIQTCKSGLKAAVLHAQNRRWRQGPIETSNSGANHAVLHTKTTDEGWDP